MYKCDFCEKEYDNKLSRGNHRRFCINNPNTIRYTHKKNNQYTKAKELGLPAPINSQKGKPGVSHPHTEDFKIKQRQHAIRRGLGGVTQAKKIVYQNKILGSTYELAVAKELDRFNVKWDTCKQFKYYDPNGKLRSYTPDLYLPDYDIYLDPKNDFLINNINPALGFMDIDKIKLASEQNNIAIIILNKTELYWEAILQKINSQQRGKNDI